MATGVSEKEARQVAEEARESEWKLPSFGKELFLGNFCLDLIHPQPKLDPQAVEKGEKFLATLRDTLVMMIIVSDNTCTGTVVDLVGLDVSAAIGRTIDVEVPALRQSLAWTLQQMAADSAAAAVHVEPPAHPLSSG